jgi:hypothetical protein
VSDGITLACPFCETVVADALPEIGPGRCPGCDARYEGGEDSAPATVRAALAAYNADDLPAGEILDNLFRLSPDDDLAHRVAITSDRREDFYGWWLFVHEGPEGARGTLACLTRHRHAGSG